MRGKFAFINTVLIVFGLLTSCQSFFFDDLSIISKELAFDAKLSHVTVSHGFNIVLKQDTSNYAIIEAAADIINEVDCFANGDTLILNDNNPMKWRTAYPTPTVTIGFREIRELKIYSPSNISTLGDINQDYFKIFATRHIGEINLNVNAKRFVLITGNTNNMGIYNITGSADDAYIWMRNTCSLNALEFRTKNARVINNSKADCYVMVSNEFNVTLNSSGDLYYKGTPTEYNLEEHSGTGRIIRIE